MKYDNTEDHYNNASALYDITFAYDESDEQCLTALDEVKSILSVYDIYVSTELGNAEQEAIDSEVRVIMVYVAIIIVPIIFVVAIVISFGAGAV